MLQNQLSNDDKEGSSGGISNWSLPSKVILIIAVLVSSSFLIDQAIKSSKTDWPKKTLEEIRQDASSKPSLYLSGSTAPFASDEEPSQETSPENSKVKLSRQNELKKFVFGNNLPEDFVLLSPEKNIFEEYLFDIVSFANTSNDHFTVEWMAILESKSKEFHAAAVEMTIREINDPNFDSEKFYLTKLEELGDQNSYLAFGKANQRTPAEYRDDFSSFSNTLKEQFLGRRSSSFNRGIQQSQDTWSDLFETDINFEVGKFSLVSEGKDFVIFAGLMTMEIPSYKDLQVEMLTTFTIFTYNDYFYILVTYSGVDDKECLKNFSNWLLKFFY